MTYSSAAALNRQRFSGRNQNSTSFKAQEATLGPVSNAIMLILLACLLGLMYLTQVTKTNAFGYQINKLTQEQSSLQTEHDELEIAAARLQSLERVKNSEVAKNMVSVASSGTVAR